MAETLVECVRRIEAIPKYITIARDAEMRKAFEEYAGNAIVRAVMDGRTTFTQAYQNALGEYDSWRPFLPQFPPEGFEQNIAYLEAAIGESPLDYRWQSKLENPFGMAAMFGLGGAGVQAIKPLHETTRRDFNAYVAAGLSFSVLGLLVGEPYLIKINRHLKYLSKMQWN